MPVIQIVYETLKSFEEHKTSKQEKVHATFKINIHDRTEALAIDSEGLLCQSRDVSHWHGARCLKGVVYKGRYYYEVAINDEGICRVGWSTQDASLDLGTDQFGFGYGATGMKSTNGKFDKYGEV